MIKANIKPVTRFPFTSIVSIKLSQQTNLNQLKPHLTTKLDLTRTRMHQDRAQTPKIQTLRVRVRTRELGFVHMVPVKQLGEFKSNDDIESL